MQNFVLLHTPCKNKGRNHGAVKLLSVFQGQHKTQHPVYFWWGLLRGLGD